MKTILSVISLVFLMMVWGVAGAAELPPNRWQLLHEENADGGKTFARAIYAGKVKQVYLWGTGGKKPARNVFERYELEAFDLKRLSWKPAFPMAAIGRWTADDFPPFRIYGQSGPDGLKYDEGPRLQTVGGYQTVNRIRWWDFAGILRPSPIHTFNMACLDTKRGRILYYSDGITLALDPKTNGWTDLKAKNHPLTCRHVAWASLCYDAGSDRALLFGGGLATNPEGGAPTWIYDCAANEWHRANCKREPPLRCNGPIVYDAATKSMVLFGGYTQAAALNDTWVFDCKTSAWSERTPKLSPPPMEAPAAVALGGGKVLVCGNDARKVRRGHRGSTAAQKETWLYDVSANTWIPLDAGLNLPNCRWLTACPSGEENVALLVAFGAKRRTYAFRYDPKAKPTDLPGAPAGTVAWKYPEQKESLEKAARTPDPVRSFKDLPANTFVNANPPGLLISKTWSTAVMDVDRGEVLYIGGGHSGYSGNDVARYSLDRNRWTLDQPPRFPPFLEGTNAGIYGWSYGMMPFSQHTYLWYCYDPASKKLVYLARPSIPDGVDLQLGDDPAKTFRYEAKKHGYASWVYDPATRRMHTPVFGRPFKNPWHLTLVGTPGGVFAASDRKLYHAKVTQQGGIRWRLVDETFPKPPEVIKYHYEFQPIVHDLKRDRLIQLKGDKTRVDVYTRGLAEDAQWSQLETKGRAAIGREAVYLPKQDVVLWLGDHLFAFDCATQTMAEVPVEIPKGSLNHECAFIYDPKRDLCVALIPSKFTGPMQTFLFRYEPKKAKLR